MKLKEKKTEITERDRRIMRWILEQKFMTEKQIKRLFWKGAKKDSVESYRRLERLRRAGYLKTNKMLLYRSAVYLVTGKGVEELRRSNQNSGLGEITDANYANHKHDLAVTDIRILFHELGVKDWLSERVLAKRGELRHMPDGMIYHRERYVAIEYESTQKSKDRYREIFYDYELDRLVDHVLYIVDTPELSQAVSRHASGCSKLYFTSLGDIQENLINTKLKDSSGQRSLRELLGGVS